MKVKFSYTLFTIFTVSCCWLGTAVAQDEDITATISNVPTTTQNGAFTVTITFSENVTGFETEDISLTGTATASVTDLAQGTNTSTYTATITPTADGTVIIVVNANAVTATDDADKNNAASDSHTVTVDVPPAVKITNVPTTTQNGAFTVEITFSEIVSNFGASDITLSGTAEATVTDLTQGTDASTYTATITPTTDGTVIIQVPDNVAQDTGNNNNTASDAETVTVDVPPTVVISNIPDIEKNEPFDITITFSEFVNDFQVDNILTGPATATLIDGSDGDTEYTATIIPGDDAEDDVVIQVPVGTAQDFGRNDNSESDAHTVHIDTRPPTVAITEVPDIEKNEPFDITITFSEPVNGFQIDDIEITGPAMITLTSGTDGDAEYTATITPDTDAENDVIIQVPVGAAQDFALNSNSESDAYTVHIDTRPPTVAITEVPDIEKNQPFDITITFSEPVNGFQIDDIETTGPAMITLISGTDGDAEYTATITPSDDAEGEVTFKVPADATQDFALNNNSESDAHAVYIDTIPPTVAITEVPDIEKNEPFDITITFSEPVNDFQVDNILTGPATASIITGVDGNDEYIVTITPNEDAEDEVIIQVPVGAAQDFALNDNTESDEHTVHIDTRPPTVAITEVPDIEKNEPFDITITFSESVNGFQVDNILTGPATASIITGVDGDSEYTATITPDTDAEDDVIIQVPVGTAQDFALNNNSESDIHTVHIDTRPPTVAITDVSDIEKNEPFDITITFSEPVNGFQIEDIELTGPAMITLTSGTDGDAEYTATITPDGDAENEVTFKVSADTTQDFALNSNTASQQHSVHIDTIPPTVAITDVPDIEKNEPFDITITFSEPVNGFQVDNILTGPATANIITGVDGDTEYTATITPNDDAEDDVSIQVPVGAAQDFALNDNSASDAHTVHIDTIPPTVAITDVPDIEKNQPFDITITFSEPVNGFQIDDIELTGTAMITLTSGVNGDSIYEATITPDESTEEVVEFYVRADTSQDFALNDNIESTEYTVHVDTIPPTVEIIDVPIEVQLEAFSVSIIFSEIVNDFEVGGIEITGEAVVDELILSGSSSDYVLTIMPNENTDGDVIIAVPEDAARDEATNANTSSRPQSVSVAPKWIPDPNLRTAVREGLGLDIGEDFAQEQLEDLIALDGFYRDITDLTGLEQATTLTSLELTGNSISDLTPLAGLTTLTTLLIGDNYISDITVLEDLIELTTLNLEANIIDDITVLENLTELTTLNLNQNLITDLNPLAGLTALTHLYLMSNAIRDVSSLANLENLEVLHITENPILDTRPLAGLVKIIEVDVEIIRKDVEVSEEDVDVPEEDTIIPPVLTPDPAEEVEIPEEEPVLTPDPAEEVEIPEEDTIIPPVLIPDPALAAVLRNTLDLDASTPITSTLLERLTTLQAASSDIANVTGLEHAIALTTLELSGNAIIDITPLQNLTKLKTLNLSGNAIIDITPLQNLTELNTLNLSRNTISNLNTLSGLTRLTTLDLSTNAISDLSALARLKQLRVLNLNNNTVSDLIPLAGLMGLTTLGLVDNAITNLAPITTLTQLQTLNLNSNRIDNINPLTGLTQLTTLDLINNNIVHVAPLAGLINLTTLRLAENPILDTTPLYPLTQRVPPVNIDIAVSQFPPWDVNEDGSVSILDLVIVASALSQSAEDIVNPRTDVNKDGSVNILDLVLLAQHFGNNTANAP